MRLRPKGVRDFDKLTCALPDTLIHCTLDLVLGLVVGLLLALLPFGLFAQSRLLDIALDREGAQLPVFVMPHPQASATLILLPGGDAGTGKIVAGLPGSGNFLSRSRDYFHAAGFNVIVAYRPSDLRELDYDYRISKAHIGEIDTLVTYAVKEFGKPVWLVGTSRGSVSATAAAIALGPSKVQGLVLTSSVTSKKPGAIASQDIAQLRVPSLVVHHKNDACPICVPAQAAQLIAGFAAAPISKFVMIESGYGPQGDVCAARHWHGFINAEQETVTAITSWIKAPAK